jgi:hypothetical protein
MDALTSAVGAMIAAGVYYIGVIVYRKIKKQHGEDQGVNE